MMNSALRSVACLVVQEQIVASPLVPSYTARHTLPTFSKRILLRIAHLLTSDASDYSERDRNVNRKNARLRKFFRASIVPVMEPIGDTIRRLRGKRRQAQLAESVGMRSSHWSQIENGHRADPTLSTLERIARALGIRTSSLLAERER